MSLFSYIAVLGRQPELGLVELESVLGGDAVQAFGGRMAFVRELPQIDRLGGSMKLAEVLYHGELADLQALPVEIEALPMNDGKTPFAVSLYMPRSTRRQAEAVGLALKKRLRMRGSVRLVQPTDGAEVSAAGLKHNQVLEKGFELLIAVAGKTMVVAQTVSVQDIDAYAARDYGRPARSATVGMLPPKLAQILINTTQSPMVADPFCGTGVVLQEARLMGRSTWGSDLSPEMIAATTTNMEWLSQTASGPLGSWHIEPPTDAQTVQLPAGCAVVSEGYLGPNQLHAPSPAELQGMKQDLLALYVACLANWAPQLASGAELALCVPAWRIGRAWSYLGLVDELPRLGYTPKSFQSTATPLLYARDNQVVGRQLLLMRKN